MKNVNNTLFAGLLVGILVIGLFGGAVFFPREVEKEVIVEKNVTIEKIVEVPSNITCDECGITPLDLREQAFDDFWEHLDDEDLFVCKNEEYDESEVSLSKLYDKFSVRYDVEFDEKEYDYVVDFSAKLKFKESDLRSCRDVFDVSVFYEEGKDPKVEFVTIE